MKKTSLAAFLLITALLISSCGSALRNAVTIAVTDERSHSTNTAKPPVTTAYQTTTDEPVITEPEITTDPVIPGPVIPEMTGPVMNLTCLDTKETITSIYDAGEGRAVVECIRYDNEYEDDYPGDDDYYPEGSLVSHTLYLIDTLTDAVLAQRDFSQESENLMMIGVMLNGETVIFNYENNRLSFCNEKFELTRSFEIPDRGYGYFELFRTGEKSEILCYVNSAILYEVNCETGELSQLVAFADPKLYINSYDCENGLVLVSAQTDSDIYTQEAAVYSVKDEKFVYHIPGFSFSSYFFDDYLICERYESENDENGEYLFDHEYYYVYDKASGKQIKAFELNGVNLYEHQTGNAFGVNYSYSDDYYSVENVSLEIADISSGKYAEYDLGSKYFSVKSCYTAFSGRYLIGATENSDDPRSSLFVFDDSFIELDKNVKSIEFKDQTEESVITLPDYLREAREKADAIERDFSVRVLIDDECLMMSEPSDYTLTSTSEDDEWGGVVTDEQKAEQISQALDKLREGLSFYPEGFFKKFRNYRDAGGIRIAIPRDIISTEDTTFTAGGIQYDFGAWYNIWIDIDELWVTDTLHHEIWHAVETLINNTDYYFYESTEWNSLNPENFEYQYDLDNYYEAKELDKYLIENKIEPYFARIYSTVNEKEDRATLIEFILSENFENYSADYYGHPTAYETVCSFPGMKAKLDFMATAVENVFGYVYWEP